MRATWVHCGLTVVLAMGCGEATRPSTPETAIDGGVGDQGPEEPPAGDGGPGNGASTGDGGVDLPPGVRCDDPAADVSCDDGDPCTDDVCDEISGHCVSTPVTCDDGVFCNGVETCDAALGCVSGATPGIDDGIPCTVDACDEAAGAVTHTPEDLTCDDAVFCNGVEICDATLGCQSGVPPDTGDGIDCTLDACDEGTGSFTHLALNSACDDGLVCNGTEICATTLGCQSGAPPEADDGVDCTVDSCDDDAGGLVHTPDDGLCGNGVFCDGAELCDPTLGCEPSAPPATDDGVECTVDTCDEEAGAVTHTPDDTLCETGGLCVLEGCNSALGCFSSLIANCCGNGLLESGESCDDGNDEDGDGCTTECKLPAVVLVAGAFRHTCVLFQGGTAKCWGWNAWGQLGPAGSGAVGDEPGEMGPDLLALNLGTDEDGSPVEILDLDVGGSQTCAVLATGQVKCWGNNVYGQLGLGNTTGVGSKADDMGDALPAVDLGSDGSGASLQAVAVDTAAKHGCALLAGGSLKCWGNNDYGQLGIGDVDTRGDDPDEMGDALPFVDLGTDDGGEPLVVTAVANSEWHACAIVEGGRMKCWGKNGYGELGIGDSDDRGDEPGEMGDALPFVDLGTDDAGEPLAIVTVAARNSSTCAVLEGGGVKCWGYGGPSLGLGPGGGNRGDSPDEMGDNLPYVDLGAAPGTGAPLDVVEITEGPCALFGDGQMKCWGYNDHGQLGLGDLESRGDQAEEMGDALPFVDLGAGGSLPVIALTAGYKHTCAVLGDGRVKCWGQNAENAGQLGLEDTDDRGDEPEEMGDNLPYVDLGQ